MRRTWMIIGWLALLGVGLLWPQRAGAQGGAYAENLLVSAQRASTWVDSQNPATNIVQLEGKVVIELDRTRMTADAAVIWLTPAKKPVLDELQAQIALLGNAVLDEPGQLQRSGDRLIVTASVRGTIRVTADERRVGSLENSEYYKIASTLRPLPATAGAAEIDNWLLQPTTMPATRPATQPAQKLPLGFSADHTETTLTVEGTVALVVTGNVKIFQRRGDTEMLELQADRAVLFTPLHDMREIDKNSQFTKVEEAITAAYLEGDVRIVHTPPAKRGADQRLAANRVYYDFETDRAVLTDAVIHTVEPSRGLPIVIRAQTVRQLSMGEYRARDVQLSQSSFYTPSYHIGMKQAYIRQIDTGDPRMGTLMLYEGKPMTINAFGTPFFYLPSVSGSMTERGTAMRNINVAQDNRYGFGLRSTWGVFETLGILPPKDLDLDVQLDYYTKRGPAAGINSTYGGGYITENTRQPWAFEGTLQSYFVEDHGEDNLGRRRLLVEPETSNRYRVVWEHQHWFPDDWQVQVTTGLMSDPTFQEEWFEDPFQTQRQLDTAVYLKRQKQSEAFTLLYSFQPNKFVTTSDLMQEKAEVERMPEIGYRLLGESIGGDNFTLFSENTIAGLRFRRMDTNLITGWGFRPSDSPGLPSYGRTGLPSDITWRTDFREEIDYPFSLGQFRVVPYLMGRYTSYSRSPEESANDRFMAAAGVRLTTAFWKVDDTVESQLWDIHRLRHVIEPQVDFFTSAQTTGRDRLFQYDEPIDEINDITAVQVALRQRWQTKRGGPGRWRSVDFFTLNIEGNFFMNRPKGADLMPEAFRGLYFMSEPEASIPRNNINSDFTWRISDTSALLGDAQYNLDKSILSTASIGLAVSHDTRLAYFFGVRYIDSGGYVPVDAAGALLPTDRHSVVVSGAINYELTNKYNLAVKQAFDFGERQDVLTYLSLIRHFDRWYMSFTYRVDYIGDQSGFFVNLWPEGLGTAGTTADRMQQVFR